MASRRQITADRVRGTSVSYAKNENGLPFPKRNRQGKPCVLTFESLQTDELQPVWWAEFYRKKLTKKMVVQCQMPKICGSIKQKVESSSVSLRWIAALLHGACVLFEKQVDYLATTIREFQEYVEFHAISAYLKDSEDFSQRLILAFEESLAHRKGKRASAVLRQLELNGIVNSILPDNRRLSEMEQKLMLPSTLENRAWRHSQRSSSHEVFIEALVDEELDNQIHELPDLAADIQYEDEAFEDIFPKELEGANKEFNGETSSQNRVSLEIEQPVGLELRGGDALQYSPFRGGMDVVEYQPVDFRAFNESRDSADSLAEIGQGGATSSVRTSVNTLESNEPLPGIRLSEGSNDDFAMFKSSFSNLDLNEDWDFLKKQSLPAEERREVPAANVEENAYSFTFNEFDASAPSQMKKRRKTPAFTVDSDDFLLPERISSIYSVKNASFTTHEASNLNLPLSMNSPVRSIIAGFGESYLLSVHPPFFLFGEAARRAEFLNQVLELAISSTLSNENHRTLLSKSAQKSMLLLPPTDKNENLEDVDLVLENAENLINQENLQPNAIVNASTEVSQVTEQQQEPLKKDFGLITPIEETPMGSPLNSVKRARRVLGDDQDFFPRTPSRPTRDDFLYFNASQESVTQHSVHYSLRKQLNFLRDNLEGRNESFIRFSDIMKGKSKPFVARSLLNMLSLASRDFIHLEQPKKNEINIVAKGEIWNCDTLVEGLSPTPISRNFQQRAVELSLSKGF